MIPWFAAALIGIVLMNIPKAASFPAPCFGVVGFLLHQAMAARRPVPARA